jgi:hypothetical protein
MPPDNPADQPNDASRWQRDAARNPGRAAEGDEAHGFEQGSEAHGFVPGAPPVIASGDPTLSPTFGKIGMGRGGFGRFRPSLSPADRYGCATTIISVAVVLLIIILALLILSGGGDDGDAITPGGDGTTEVSPSATGDASPGPSSEATSEATEQSTEVVSDRQLLQIGETVIDLILNELDITTDIPGYELNYIEDELRAFLDSISSNTPTYTSEKIDIRLYGGLRASYTADGITEAWANTIYPCGENTGTRIVVCADDSVSMPQQGGDVWMFAMALEDDVPLAAGDHSYIYSAVFDSDGQPANDWQFRPPFDFDLFRDTDRWYQLIWNHQAGQWNLTVTQVNNSQQTASVPSAVRAVIQGDTIVFFIPASEFSVDRPPYRMTAFGHDGAFSESDRGADVSGTDPTAPLTVPPGDVFPAMPEGQ